MPKCIIEGCDEVDMKREAIIHINIEKRTIYYFISFICLIICCFFSDYKIASYVSFAIYIAYIVVIILNSPRVIFKYLYFFFMMVANVLGCFICEFGDLYLIEIETNTHYVGALPVLVLAQLVFFTCIYERETKTGNKSLLFYSRSRINERTLFFLNCFVFILYGLLFVHILPYSALNMNVDRMTFASMEYNGGIWNYLSKWTQFFIVIPIGCIVYTKNKGYKAFGIITLFVYCLYYLWIGNKFGPFFSLFCVFCMLMFSRLDIKEKTIKRVFLIVIAAMLAFVFAAAYIFTNYQSKGTDIIYYLQKRLAEQGQLFWKTYEASAGKYHISEISTEISGQLHSANNAEELLGAKYGIYNIMYLCAPKQRVDGVILYGSRYTEAGYASAYYYFGIIGCILFAMIVARLIVLVTNAVATSTRNNNLLGMFFMIRMFFIICTAWQMFLFRDFITGTSIITYIWLCFFTGEKKIIIKNGRLKILSFHI